MYLRYQREVIRIRVYLRYQREVIIIRVSKIPKGGNQNPYIEEEQTTQWPKEKEQTTIYKTYTSNTNTTRN